MAVVCSTLGTGCADTEVPLKPEENIVLTWGESKSQLRLWATDRLTLAQCITMLHVKHKGKMQSVMLDDDVCFKTVRFLKYKDWILVLNGKYVLGGYHIGSGKIYGEYDWDQLPFTVWGISGKVLAQKRIDTGTSGIPCNFPMISEPVPAHAENSGCDEKPENQN